MHIFRLKKRDFSLKENGKASSNFYFKDEAI